MYVFPSRLNLRPFSANLAPSFGRARLRCVSVSRTALTPACRALFQLWDWMCLHRCMVLWAIDPDVEDHTDLNRLEPPLARVTRRRPRDFLLDSDALLGAS